MIANKVYHTWFMLYMARVFSSYVNITSWWTSVNFHCACLVSYPLQESVRLKSWVEEWGRGVICWHLTFMFPTTYRLILYMLMHCLATYTDCSSTEFDLESTHITNVHTLQIIHVTTYLKNSNLSAWCYFVPSFHISASDPLKDL